ncbi:hypothetical protein ACTXT7_013302 [Hymenolepis weldensis]
MAYNINQPIDMITVVCLDVVNAPVFAGNEVQDTTTHTFSADNPGQPIRSTLPPPPVYFPGYEYFAPTVPVYYPMHSYGVQGYPTVSTPTYQPMPSYTDQGMPSSSFIIPQNMLVVGGQHIPMARPPSAPAVIEQENSQQVYALFQAIIEQGISQPTFTSVPSVIISRNPPVEYPRPRALSVVADHEIPLSYPMGMPRLEASQASFSPNPTVTTNPFPNRNRVQQFNTQLRPRAKSFERMPYNPRMASGWTDAPHQ